MKILWLGVSTERTVICNVEYNVIHLEFDPDYKFKYQRFQKIDDDEINWRRLSNGSMIKHKSEFYNKLEIEFQKAIKKYIGIN